MAEVKMPHPGHENHLCFIQNMGYFMVDYKELVRDPKFVCRKCGRAASKKEYVCEPEELAEPRDPRTAEKGRTKRQDKGNAGRPQQGASLLPLVIRDQWCTTQMSLPLEERLSRLIAIAEIIKQGSMFGVHH